MLERGLELTRAAWAQRIGEAWESAAQAAIGAWLQIGRDLIAARASLPHGEFLQMVASELPFGKRTAQMLMKVAASPRLTNANHGSRLPASWRTLYELTRLPDAEYDALLEDGSIRPDLDRREVTKHRLLAKVEADERRARSLVTVEGKFRTIVLDPAWDYDVFSEAIRRAEGGYCKQSIEELLALDVRRWADEESGCHLYLWATNAFAGRGHELLNAWGFAYKITLTWVKPPPFGLGTYFRNSTEQVLFATLGDTTTRHAAASIPTHFEAPRGEHSEKPERFYEIVRAASYPPYGEGNQREPRPDFVNLFQSREGEAQ